MLQLDFHYFIQTTDISQIQKKITKEVRLVSEHRKRKTHQMKKLYEKLKRKIEEF